MAGGIGIAVVLVIFPALVAMSGAVAAALLGTFVNRNVDEQHEGSELLATNR
jgi:hypothetical protein